MMPHNNAWQSVCVLCMCAHICLGALISYLTWMNVWLCVVYVRVRTLGIPCCIHGYTVWECDNTTSTISHLAYAHTHMENMQMHKFIKFVYVSILKLIEINKLNGIVACCTEHFNRKHTISIQNLSRNSFVYVSIVILCVCLHVCMCVWYALDTTSDEYNIEIERSAIVYLKCRDILARPRKNHFVV